jgi:hypothetical protein
LKRLIKKLPKIDLNAQAISVRCNISAIGLPNVSKLHQQIYQATLDVNQLIYNGGLIDANAKIKEAQTKTLQQNRGQPLPTQIKSAVLSRPFYKSVMLF